MTDNPTIPNGQAFEDRQASVFWHNVASQRAETIIALRQSIKELTDSYSAALTREMQERHRSNNYKLVAIAATITAAVLFAVCWFLFTAAVA